MCRDEAVDLCQGLKAAGVKVPVFAVAKEEELPPPVDAEKMRGTADFQNSYFCGPMYLDADKAFYKYLGNKPINPLELLNPFTLAKIPEKLKSKSIEGNTIGDGITKGGVLVIDPEGEVLHKFFEKTGEGVPDKDLEKIVEAAKSIKASSSGFGGFPFR